jgi:hypothetical protein
VTTTSSVTFAANTTLTALAAAIAAVGNGWTARVVDDFGGYPSADLFAPQGALDARGREAGLLLHAGELQGFEINAGLGFLAWSDSSADSARWSAGARAYRVQYTAGYITVPEDVQEACAELVASWFSNRGRDVFLAQESVKGSNYFTTEQTLGRLPNRIQALLRPYKNHRV